MDQSFGRIEVRPSLREVLVDGKRAALGARAFDVLLTLVERRNRLVTKNELFESVWPGRVVEENNLATQVGTLRKVLGADVIATIPGRGYRFVAPQTASPSLAAPLGESLPGTELGTNLPTTLMPLIARDADVARLSAALRETVLITVTGPGGVGKSCLAQRLLHEQRAAYADGVVWVELAGVSEAALVASTVARALGLQPGSGEPLQALVSGLRSLNLLIALDNAEYLVDEVARVAQALNEGAPGVRLLVTSQMPLKLTHEKVFWLEPLRVPAQSLAPLPALEFGAVALFVQRAQAAQQRFTLHEDNVDAVIDLCRRLDGLPLAIELAAARVPLLGVRALAAALGDRLNLLSSGRRLAPVRQQTLRAALEWSHGLLNDKEQRVLRRLEVFAGGFSMELAQQVVAEPEVGLDDWAVLDVLGTLIDHSLLVADPGEPPRYHLLESTRLFALEQLAAAGEEHVTRGRHARAVCARFEHLYDNRLAGRMRGDSAIDAMAPDVDNALDAVNWAIAHDPPTAIALMVPLSAARGINVAQDASLWLATQTLLTDAIPARLRARWALGAAEFWTTRDNRAEGRAWAEEAVRLQRQLGDPLGLYLALYEIAWTSAVERQGERARTMLAEMRSLEDHEWPPIVRYVGAQAEGVYEAMNDQPDAALSSYRRALSLATEAGDSPLRNFTLVCIADAALNAGQIDEAIRCGVELVERHRGSRQRHVLQMALLNLLAAFLAANSLVDARKTALEGWPLTVEFAGHAFWADHLALLAALEGRYRSAALILGYGERMYCNQRAARQPNEVRSVQRAQQLALEHLGETEFMTLRLQGASLGSEDIAGLLAASP